MRNNNKHIFPGHRTSKAQIGVAIGIFLVAWLAIPFARGDDAVRAEKPLAAEVYQALGLRKGYHPYLPALARMILALPPDLKRPEPGLWRALGRNIADVRTLVAALNDGADPLALRRKILVAVNIHGNYSETGGRPWPYGTLVARELVCALIEKHALALAKAGAPARATRYLRAALVLSCQDDLSLGWEAPLLPWVRAAVVKNWGWGFSPSEREALAAKHRSVLAMLELPPRGQRRLDDLYGLAVKQRAGRFGRAYNAFFSSVAIISKRKGKLPKAVTSTFLGRLRTAVATAPTLHWRYDLLQNALWARRYLNLAGHRRLSLGIKKVLRKWGTKTEVDHRIPELEQRALLRWIKEASI